MKQHKLWFDECSALLAQKQINITSVVESKSNNGRNMNDVECKFSTFWRVGVIFEVFKIHEVETKGKNKNVRDWYNSINE